MFAVGSSGSEDARRVMRRSSLNGVGAALASRVGMPRTKRNKVGDKEDAHIESGKQKDGMRRLERNLWMYEGKVELTSGGKLMDYKRRGTDRNPGPREFV